MLHQDHNNHPRVRVIGAALLLALVAATTGCATSEPYVSEEYTAITTPEGFPVGIPVQSGDLVEAERLGEDGWSATVVLDDSVTDAALLSKLQERGFEVLAQSEGAKDGVKSISVSLKNKSHAMTVVLSRIGEMHLAQFSYAPR